MKEPKNESELVAQIVEAILEQYPSAWWMKVHGDGYQRAGIPDVLVAIDGRLIALEVKHQKRAETAEHARGRTSALQRVELLKLRRAGVPADTVLSIEEALERIEQALRGEWPTSWHVELEL